MKPLMIIAMILMVQLPRACSGERQTPQSTTERPPAHTVYTGSDPENTAATAHCNDTGIDPEIEPAAGYTAYTRMSPDNTPATGSDAIHRELTPAKQKDKLLPVHELNPLSVIIISEED